MTNAPSTSSKKSSVPPKNMQVVVRIRPMNSREKKNRDKCSCKLSNKEGDEKAIVLTRSEHVSASSGRSKKAGKSGSNKSKSGKCVFRYDGAYGPKHETADIYEDVVQGIVKSAMEGINGMFFYFRI
eukprot:g1527.t1